MLRLRTIMGLLALALSLTMIGSVAAQDDTGTVTVVHGVPGLTVDVYLNGEAALTDFAPGTVTDPLELPAGDYQIAIRPAGAAPDSDPAITGSASLPAGANASVVAHLGNDGTPMLSVFVNDTSMPAAGEGRLIVRHTAAAPAVDVLAGGQPLFTDVTNGQEGVTDVPAGTYSVSVVPAGGDTPVLGPTDLTVEGLSITAVYAIGSLDEGTLQLLTQSITPEEPSQVVPATGGPVSSDSGIAMAALILGAGAVVAGGLFLRRRQLTTRA